MKLLTNGAVAGFCATFLAASIGSGNVEAYEGIILPRFSQHKLKAISSEKAKQPEMDEEKALSAAISAISGSVDKVLETMKKEAHSMKGALGAAGSEVKASLRKTAKLITEGLNETRKDVAPMLKGIGKYMQDVQSDLALLLPAKEIVQGMAHMVRLIKEKQQISMADSQVKRFVLRLVKLILVLSSLFYFYVIVYAGPLIWGMLLAPLAIYNLSNISTSSIAQESYFQEVETREADLIIKRTAETGMPVDKSASEGISSFLKSISDAELEKMAEESGFLGKTGITAQEFPERFRETVSSWFSQDTQ